MIKTRNYPENKFSKLFIDFTKKQSYISTIFKNENELYNDEFLKKISNNPNRSILKDVINQTCKHIELSEIQKNNLEDLSNNNTLAIVTGQQIGFLGGPLYTILKLQSAVNLSKKLSANSNSWKFVPIFWIEDNDHDKLEASKTHLYDFQNNIHTVQPSFLNDKSMCAVVEYQESIKNNINSIKEVLQNFKFKEEIFEIIDECYYEGANWTESFVKFLNYFFKDDGVLFVSANNAINSGVFSDLIKKEIENHKTTFDIINKSTQKLVENDYHQQVIPSELNLFYHQNNERINFLSEIENHRNIQNYDLYSPKALLRPIFQDYLIPNVAYIAGPGEVAYFSQISALYNYFEVEMPVVLPRHSAVFINKKQQKLIQNEDLEISYFERDYKQIEKDIAESNSDKEFNELIEKSKSLQKEIFESIKIKLTSFDKQLSQTCETALSKANEQIDFLQKKSLTAIKRNNSEKIQKYLSAKNYLFPENNFQERFFTIANLVAEYSFAELKKIIEEICEKDSNQFVEYYVE